MEPKISFGRYSDNNKSPEMVSRWTMADTLFKEKKYVESMDAFFEYLGDPAVQNVVYERNGAEGRFELYQGSKIVKGKFDSQQVRAEVTLARMSQPSIPVMRRLLETNFTCFSLALSLTICSLSLDWRMVKSCTSRSSCRSALVATSFNP